MKKGKLREAAERMYFSSLYPGDQPTQEEIENGIDKWENLLISRLFIDDKYKETK